jgi:DUF2934 family protein
MATRRSNDSQRKTKTASSMPPSEPLSTGSAADAGSAPKQAAPRRKSTSAKKQTPAEVARVDVPVEARRAMIAEAAYLRAERRGFAPGYETEDWLAAESEVDSLLSAGHGGAQ